MGLLPPSWTHSSCSCPTARRGPSLQVSLAHGGFAKGTAPHSTQQSNCCHRFCWTSLGWDGGPASTRLWHEGGQDLCLATRARGFLHTAPSQGWAVLATIHVWRVNVTGRSQLSRYERSNHEKTRGKRARMSLSEEANLKRRHVVWCQLRDSPEKANHRVRKNTSGCQGLGEREGWARGAQRTFRTVRQACMTPSL